MKTATPLNKIILGLFLCLFALSGFANNEEHKSRIAEVLNRSVFANENPPKSLLEGQIPVYDPTLIAVVASMYSSLPEKKDDSRYKELHLGPVKGGPVDSPCPNDMRVFVKASQKKNPHTFIILPGAYVSWKYGWFSNQTIAALEESFDDPNIIGLAGYLSPYFLEDTCDKIPWNVPAIAQDIRLRLQAERVLEKVQASPDKTGIIGYSGGAGLLLAMLAEDAKEVKDGNNERDRMFGLGGMSFSPTLHGLSIFHNLDESVKIIPHDRTLSVTMNSLSDPSYIMFMAKGFFKDFAVDWKDIVSLHEKNPENYRERFFNEFTYNDLNNTLSAVGFEPEDVNGDLSYYNVYVNTGFRNDRTETEGLSAEEINHLYSEETAAKPVLAQIDRPVLIYFSQDDPVLSHYEGLGQPEVVTDILHSARQNPNITVFNPKWGGHVGNFLDPIFEDLVHTFFTQGSANE